MVDTALRLLRAYLGQLQEPVVGGLPAEPKVDTPVPEGGEIVGSIVNRHPLMVTAYADVALDQSEIVVFYERDPYSPARAVVGDAAGGAPVVPVAAGVVGLVAGVARGDATATFGVAAPAGALVAAISVGVPGAPAVPRRSAIAFPAMRASATTATLAATASGSGVRRRARGSITGGMVIDYQMAASVRPPDRSSGRDATGRTGRSSLGVPDHRRRELAARYGFVRRIAFGRSRPGPTL